MAVRLPDLSILEIATGYGPAKTITGISNSNPPVVSAAAHGFANGDFVEITSGWQKLNERIFRVAGAAAGAFNLEGENTESQQDYAPGAGAGSARQIIQWVQISQVLSIETTGGEQQFVDFSFLEENFERRLPSITSAQSLSLNIADDPTLPGYRALREASRLRSLRALRLTLPNGSRILYNGIFSLNETPQLTKGQVMQVKASFAIQGLATRV